MRFPRGFASDAVSVRINCGLAKFPSCDIDFPMNTKAMDMNLLESLVTSTRDVNSDKMVSDLQLKASIHHNILLRVAHSIAEAQLMDNASFVLLDKTFDEFASLWMNMKVEVKTKEDHEARQFKFKPRAFKIENIMEIDISTLGGSLENEILSEWQELLSDEKVAEKKAEEEDDTLEEEWNLMKGSILNNMVHIHNQLFGSMDLVETNAPFDPTKKKKKKKVVIQDPADDAVDNLAEKTESLSVSDGLESTFSGLKKKKKKSVHTDLLSDEKESVVDDLDDHIGDDEEGEGIILQPQFPWEGSDRDYKYEELLDRVFHILRENNPELAGDRRRTVMRPPQVLREGTKKTVFVNFMDLCKTMHRQPEHVMTFLLAEMGTSGSLDGQQRLVVKGRFAPKNFEGILRRYVNEYVICNGCKSPDTILSKENRLFFLRCEKCGSGRSVAPIKAGFVARVGRRKAGT
ncbi:hypothetical protein TEA_000611 [Camellia sinensis var. sinensis]|uniref:Eukaryotic translation initiation factor 2 subunit beta n=1 Tax=Camellia sinensis var. sinensis TaxID=542762 RepID=A0A4S4EL68_CAMSN|nr:hypothetical protein TEA_000611 [Camellia sinensis var. sinensis]